MLRCNADQVCTPRERGSRCDASGRATLQTRQGYIVQHTPLVPTRSSLYADHLYAELLAADGVEKTLKIVITR